MNGKFVDWDDAKVHVLTHALHYGTAVFEGMRCYNTDRGPAIFRLKEHVWRWLNSARIYMMELPFSYEELMNAIRETVRVNEVPECYIRPIAYYSYGEVGVNPLRNRVDVAIAVFKWGAYLGESGLAKGVRCMVSSWRRINPQMLPPQAKASANYANAALAKMEALKAGYDEAIMLNDNGMVTEGSGENVFRVKRGILSTPPASAGVLRGVTRDSILQVASDMGIECKRIDMSREELYTSDELFFTGTAAEVTPIREVDGRIIGNGEFPTALRLQKSFLEIVKGKNSKYESWLEYLS
jgi:branched-chain amino acid aminotransferase